MTNKKEFHDEEYQFPQDDDYSAEVQPEQIVAVEAVEEPLIQAKPSASAGLAGIWNDHKRTIMIVGVVVSVAIVFSIMRALHKPAQAVPDLAAPAPAVVSQPVVDPQIVVQLANLKEDAANNVSVVRQLQGQVQQLTSSLNQSRAEQRQLSQNVMVLVSQMQQLNTQVQTLSQPKPVKVQAPVPKAPVPVITFQLRAVVPGRAWIVAGDGQSQSVTIGDPVQQYGTVQSIDADAGIVMTTSGKTIKF